MTSHNEAQQIPPAGLGDTPLHSLMHLLSIQFSLWSWCLALSQEPVVFLVPSSYTLKINSFILLALFGTFFIHFCHYFQTQSRGAAQEKRHCHCCVETCICFHICICSIISHLTSTPHVSSPGTLLRYTQHTGVMETTDEWIF